MTRVADSIFQLNAMRWHSIRFVFGVFLLFAAFLKYRDFGRSNALYDIAPQLEFGLIQIEVLFAIWLFSGWRAVAAWVCTLGLFASFAGACLAMIVQKKSTCGCFGSVDFNPTWGLLFDLAAISALSLVGRVESHRVSDSVSYWLQSRLAPRVWSLVICVASIAMISGFAGVYFSADIGSWYSRNLPVSFTGQVLVTNPSLIVASPGVNGDWQSLSFAVVNRGKEPVRLIGAMQNCKCRAIKSLPVVVPARGQVDIAVDVKLGSESSFSLLTSSQLQPRLICRWKEDE